MQTETSYLDLNVRLCIYMSSYDVASNIRQDLAHTLPTGSWTHAVNPRFFS